MVRIKRHMRKVVNLPSINKNLLYDLKSANLKRNIVTLVIIISLALIAYIPRELYLFIFHASGLAHNESSIKAIEMLNTTVMINPLFDPVVYLIRMRVLRNELKCKCATTVSPDPSPTDIEKGGQTF